MGHIVKSKKTTKKVSHKRVKKTAVKKSLVKKVASSKLKQTAKKVSHKRVKKTANSHVKKSIELKRKKDQVFEVYEFKAGEIPIKVTIEKKRSEFTPIYVLEVSAISETTEFILEKIRQELIKKVDLGIMDLSDMKKTDVVEDRFEELIKILIQKYLPGSDDETSHFLASYLKIKSLGLGNLELIMSDDRLEEIVVNEAKEPVWVYHKKYAWLKTNISLESEEQIRHYASIIGRRVGRQITVLTPLLDAHLNHGDRVNATLSPVSTEGNTITIRKFSRDPWTITKFIKTATIDSEAAALIWSAIQYELSAIIAGGTASGKTSALNVFASFFPPNQRIISIEDTREIRLPKFLHWVPLNTVIANAEGRGEITMGSLLVNSLRMRPDRILVGEVRRQREAETLFEAIHTGHSVYATFHANNAQEVVDRLTNPPINIARIMLPAISLIIVQYRNRRSGKRKTYQIAEINPDGSISILSQYDAKKDKLIEKGRSGRSGSDGTPSSFYNHIKEVTGMTNSEIATDLKEKVKILNYLVYHNIESVDSVGRIIAEYYTDKDNLMRYVNSNKLFPID